MWKNFTEKQKTQYKEYCDLKFGNTFIFCETGEPLYMDSNGYLIDTTMIINLLFPITKN